MILLQSDQEPSHQSVNMTEDLSRGREPPPPAAAPAAKETGSMKTGMEGGKKRVVKARGRTFIDSRHTPHTSIHSYPASLSRVCMTNWTTLSTTLGQAGSPSLSLTSRGSLSLFRGGQKGSQSNPIAETNVIKYEGRKSSSSPSGLNVELYRHQRGGKKRRRVHPPQNGFSLRRFDLSPVRWIAAKKEEGKKKKKGGRRRGRGDCSPLTLSLSGLRVCNTLADGGESLGPLLRDALAL